MYSREEDGKTIIVVPSEAAQQARELENEYLAEHVDYMQHKAPLGIITAAAVVLMGGACVAAVQTGHPEAAKNLLEIAPPVAVLVGFGDLFFSLAASTAAADRNRTNAIRRMRRGSARNAVLGIAYPDRPEETPGDTTPDSSLANKPG